MPPFSPNPSQIGSWWYFPINYLIHKDHQWSIPHSYKWIPSSRFPMRCKSLRVCTDYPDKGRDPSGTGCLWRSLGIHRYRRGSYWRWYTWHHADKGCSHKGLDLRRKENSGKGCVRKTFTVLQKWFKYVWALGFQASFHPWNTRVQWRNVQRSPRHNENNHWPHPHHSLRLRLRKWVLFASGGTLFWLSCFSRMLTSLFCFYGPPTHPFTPQSFKPSLFVWCLMGWVWNDLS